MRRAKEQEILKLDTRALGLDPSKIGMAGSPTKGKSLVMPEAPDREKKQYDSAEEGAQAIYEALHAPKTEESEEGNHEQLQPENRQPD